MPHPAHYFIKFLLVTLTDPSMETVNDNLLMHGVRSICNEEYSEYKKEVGSMPSDYRPWDRAHRSTTKWLNRQKIFSLIHQDDAVRLMEKEIMAKPKAREVIERLLISDMKAKEISYRLSKIDIFVPDLSIEIFSHYFWNTTLMGFTDWADYFANDDSERTRSSNHLYSVALYAGPEAAMYRAGVQTELDSKKIMMDVQRELYTTFLETKTLPLSTKKVDMLSTLARSLAKIDERVQAGDSALHETLKKFEKFKILTPQDTMPSIADLTVRGSVTNKER